MKIDIYNHVVPMPYLDMAKQHSKDPGIVKRMVGVRLLWDIEARVEMLERFPDVRQVLTLGMPPPEVLGGPDLSPQLARLANDGLAEMCRRWPQKFPAFVASLPMNNVPEALAEKQKCSSLQDPCYKCCLSVIVPYIATHETCLQIVITSGLKYKNVSSTFNLCSSMIHQQVI